MSELVSCSQASLMILMIQALPERLLGAYHTALGALLAARTPDGHWVGELSTSALSTATAVGALSIVQKAGHGSFDCLITNGLEWLVANQHPFGGGGDTTKSLSN